jgi:uncharacterized damage-inducible protein DinB
METTTAAGLVRQQFQGSRRWSEGTVEGLTNEQAHWQPSGTAHSIAASYAHLVNAEDAFVNGLLQSKTPLAASEFAGRTGLSEPHPMGQMTSEWARQVQVDLPALRAYAAAVYAATDAYLSSIDDDELARPIDLTAMGYGMQSVGSILTTVMHNTLAHAGEIACVKGLQGLKGFSF